MPKWNSSHAKIDRVVINLDGGGEHPNHHILCAWDECDKQGYDSNRVQINDAAPGHESRLIKYVFCSERHKQFFINSTRSYGQLPAGFKRSSI